MIWGASSHDLNLLVMSLNDFSVLLGNSVGLSVSIESSSNADISSKVLNKFITCNNTVIILEVNFSDNSSLESNALGSGNAITSAHSDLNVRVKAKLLNLLLNAFSDIVSDNKSSEVVQVRNKSVSVFLLLEAIQALHQIIELFHGHVFVSIRNSSEALNLLWVDELLLIEFLLSIKGCLVHVLVNDVEAII